MAGCGTSCRRLRGEGGIKVEPDCCGGCIVSVDPASLPAGGGGITQEQAQQIAASAAKAAVDTYAATDQHTGAGITQEQAQQIAADAAKAAVDAYAATDQHTAGITEAQAQQIAKDAVDAYAATDDHTGDGTGITEAQAQQIAQDAVDAYAATDQHTAGITEAQAQQIAADAAKAAVDAYAATDDHGGDSLTEAQVQQIANDAAKAAVEQYMTDHPVETSDDAQAKADKALADAKDYADSLLAGHADACHKLTIKTDGVTVEDGWTLDAAELRTIGGSNVVRIRIKRTGDNLASMGPDYQPDGGPAQQGNIVPDLVIGHVPADEGWAPPTSWQGSGHTGFTRAGIRVEKTGELIITDLTYNNPIQTGTTLQFEYNWLTESPCEAGSGDSGTTPVTGITRADVQQIADAAVQAALKDHADVCHKLTVKTDGVTVEDGWTLDAAELRSIGGSNIVRLRIKRTGEDIASKGPDYQPDGGPAQQGNIVPDLLVAHVPADQGWAPPTSWQGSGHTGFTRAGMRVEKTGEVIMTDLTYNNPIQTGTTLQFEYSWLTESACEIGDDTGTTPGIKATVKPDPADASGRSALLTISE